MSLLLQALKKAEEDKRRRAAQGNAEDVAAAPEVEFPTLNLVETEALESAPQIELAAVVDVPPAPDVGLNDWAVVQPDMPAEVTLAPDTAAAELGQDRTDLPELIESPLSVVDSEPIVPQVSATLPEVEVAPLNQSAAEINESAGAPVSMTPPPLVTAVSQSMPAQAIAKNFFTRSNNQPTRGLLPWLLLGAGLLLAGMMSWFVWQYRQLTQPIAAIEVPASPPNVASVSAVKPTYTDEAIVDNNVAEDTSPNQVESIDKAAAATTNVVAESLVTKPIQAEKTTRVQSNLMPPPQFVRQSASQNSPDPVLLAWQAYQSGHFEQAESLYRKVLLADPRQRDALLGLAAIAQQRGDVSAASALYQRVLRTNPQDESAKAALLLLNSAQLPEQEAVQLEQSGKSDPMVLGQYFASQQRWSQAQEQFFLAYSANPNSADAALNLAVSLDHLKQSALAKTYYLKALQATGTYYFDRSQVEQRLAELNAATGATP